MTLRIQLNICKYETRASGLTTVLLITAISTVVPTIAVQSHVYAQVVGTSELSRASWVKPNPKKHTDVLKNTKFVNRSENLKK